MQQEKEEFIIRSKT